MDVCWNSFFSPLEFQREALTDMPNEAWVVCDRFIKKKKISSMHQLEIWVCYVATNV